MPAMMKQRSAQPRSPAIKALGSLLCWNSALAIPAALRSRGRQVERRKVLLPVVERATAPICHRAVWRDDNVAAPQRRVIQKWVKRRIGVNRLGRDIAHGRKRPRQFVKRGNAHWRRAVETPLRTGRPRESAESDEDKPKLAGGFAQHPATMMPSESSVKRAVPSGLEPGAIPSVIPFPLRFALAEAQPPKQCDLISGEVRLISEADSDSSVGR